MPVHVHKLTTVKCLAPPRRGGESVIHIECTCEVALHGPYSLMLQWWERHLTANLGSPLPSSVSFAHAYQVAR